MEMLNEIVIKYIKPELLILVFVLYGLGAILKRTQKISNTLIPLLLLICGILMALIWCLGTSDYTTQKEIWVCVFTSITQGILCAATAVFGNQFFKQIGKGD